MEFNYKMVLLSKIKIVRLQKTAPKFFYVQFIQHSQRFCACVWKTNNNNPFQ